MVRRAIIPAAGLGTRFLPATKVQPKEMLPIIDTPTIQYVVQEAIEQTLRGKNYEIQITDAMRILLKREAIYSYKIEGKRYDIGNKLDYLKTIVEFALKRKEFKKPFQQFLREVIRKSFKKQK